MTRDSLVLTTCLALAVCVSALALGDGLQKEGLDAAAPYVYVPDTVSLRAQQILRQMKGPQGLPLPAPDDVEGWKKIRNYVPPQLKEIFKENTEAAVKRYPAQTKNRFLGGVPVIEICPPGWTDNGKTLVYIHGGGYVTGGPGFSLGGWVATETGLRIISVGYTLAPESKWDRTTDQVIAVFQALQKEGYALKNTAVFGDSAGGGLA